MYGGKWKQRVMVVWTIWLQMEQEEKNVADQSLGKRMSLLTWPQYKLIGYLNLAPLMVSQAITHKGCCGQEVVSTTSCLSHAACMLFFLALIYSPSTATLHERTPTPPHPTVWILFQTHVENVWSARYPWAFFLFSFLFEFLKSNPQNLTYFEFRLTTICEDASLHTQVW